MGGLLDASTQENLDNQREVVKNERRQSGTTTSPTARWHEHVGELCYPAGHPYHHSTIGSMAELDGARSSRTSRGFYETYYSPDNAVLTVVGDTDAEEVRGSGRAYFGALSRGLGPRRGRRARAARLPWRAQRVVLEEQVPLPRLFFGLRATRFGEPGSAAEEVLAAVLGRGRGARLFAELVTRRELAQAEGGYLAAWQLRLVRVAAVRHGHPALRGGSRPSSRRPTSRSANVRLSDAPTEAELDRAQLDAGGGLGPGAVRGRLPGGPAGPARHPVRRRSARCATGCRSCSR